MKKTDLITDLQSNPADNLTLMQASISNIELQVTNKEVKELKDFTDNFNKYHE